ncbi:peptidylprolyl isomerase [Acetivibrio cellulolyticus]|uniref:peptidylprolyl isomerase n=1 Tax=Acetivibrio cellulolyticus TaxID=35830 RepID=UPI0001E2D185|nr:peptidylprolyl isomerase [Acetivibrio cellulolyticus]
MNSSKIKKGSIIAGAVILVAGITVGGIMYFNNKPVSEKASEVGSKDEKEDLYGYQVLKVGGEFVDKKLFQDEKSQIYLKVDKQADLMQASQEEIDDRILSAVIDDAVVNNFLINKSGKQVTEAEIDEYIKVYIKSKYDNDEDFKVFLTTSDYESEDELRDVAKLFLLKLKVMPDIAAEYGITVTDKELNEEYESFKAANTEYTFRHIYISNEKKSDQEALNLANNIYKQLSEGADFKELAKKYSDDQDTKNNGGLNEYVPFSSINEELKAAYSNAKVGELIAPVKMKSGYNIALIEHIGKFYPDIESYKKNMLLSKFNESDKYKEWLEKIKSQETIEILDTAMRAYREFASGEYLKAGQDYEAAYKEDKNYVNLEKAAESYGMLKNWEETIRVCDIGINVNSSASTFYTYKGVSLYRTNKTEEGLKLLKKAEEVAGDNFNSLALVESAYKDLGLQEDAARVNKKYYEKEGE